MSKRVKNPPVRIGQVWRAFSQLYLVVDAPVLLTRETEQVWMHRVLHLHDEFGSSTMSSHRVLRLYESHGGLFEAVFERVA